MECGLFQVDLTITRCVGWVLCVFGCSHESGASGRSDQSGWSSMSDVFGEKILRQIYTSDMGCDPLSEKRWKNCQVLQMTLNNKS